MTLNEGLNWIKDLRRRVNELEKLRNENTGRERRLWGNEGKEIVTEPTYDIKVIDKLINRINKEIRLVDTAIKATNAKVAIEGYEPNLAVLEETIG